MAMHSYMRANSNQNQISNGSVILNPDMINNFLKDKQAWEHAISHYQGTDPLDHWYNYICWYENHAHTDPERKFRETLERCLTVYEHNEYYKQDVRLVRLWLKYIAMQTDQLRFYQVLFQRGTGRQVAAFYIGWARYYEEHEQYKDAEAVFNLAFQQGAHSTAELQNAHAKFSHGRSMFYQQQLQHQQFQLQEDQQRQIQAQPLGALQQLTSYTQSHHQRQDHLQTQPSHPHVSPTKFHQIHQNDLHEYQQHPQERVFVPNSQLSQQPISQHQEQSFHSVPMRQHFHQPFSGDLPNQTHGNLLCSQMHQARVLSHEGFDQQVHQSIDPVSASEQSNQIYLEQQNNLLSSFTEIEGVRLPGNFHAYGRNNHETWKPALTLEEPEDPSRVCHYAKQLVYPVGAGIEYSPEELLARKYMELLEQRKQQKALHTQEQTNCVETNNLEMVPEHLPKCESSALNDSVQSEMLCILSNANGEHAVIDDQDSINYGKIEAEREHHINPHKMQSNENFIGDHINDSKSVLPKYSNGVDLDRHFTAKTTFQQQNRSIKIKFKKERSLESSTYSAYTIESIYHHQQELTLPMQERKEVSPNQEHNFSKALAIPRQRNGNHLFHPYMLGRSSTPKRISNECARVCVNAKSKKFKSEICSNSNSSGSVPDQQADGASETLPVSAGSEDAARQIQNASFNDNANFSFPSAGVQDNSNSSLSIEVDRLHFRESSNLSGNNKLIPGSHNNTITQNSTSANLVDFSAFQENSYFATQGDCDAQERRLTKSLDIISRHLAKEAIDPFNSELCRAFLTKLNFPGDKDEHTSYKLLPTPLPKISNSRTLSVVEGVQFSIDKEVGRGSYGSVYKATDSRTGDIVALKYQKPPNTWEIYICDQVLRRIRNPEVLPGLMEISTAIIAPNASIIATQFSPFGSLLDINNKIRQATRKVMHESLVMHFSAQICNIVDHLHKQHIIHADIKPDNFLLMRVPNPENPEPSLRLIDFGCAIDMSLFPNAENTKFRKVVQTDGFTCIEMQEGRPWSYETDLFCIASTVHVMLFGDYMHPEKRATRWDIRQKLPRYLKKHVWSKFFSELLNMQSDKLPQLQNMRIIFDEECCQMESELLKQIRTLSNILHRR